MAVVLLHAAIAYTVAPMPGLPWPVGHHRTSVWVDGLFWVIASSVMPLFFAVSGYCAAQAVSDHGVHEFVQRRVRRILWPLLAAMPCLLPAAFYVCLLGWVVEGRLAPQKLRSLKLGPLHRDLWGLAHLWYLEYLLLICLGFALWSGWRSRRSRREPAVPSLARMTQSGRQTAWVSIVLGAAAATAVLWWSPETVVGFQHGFLPSPAKFAYSAVFFAYGVFLHGHRPTPWLWGVACIGLSVALFGLLWPTIHLQVAAQPVGWPRLKFALLAGAFAAVAVTSCWMLTVERKTLDSRVAAYLAGASFWIYLVHVPLMGVPQIALSLTAWPAEGQFLAAATVTLVLVLASYEVLVRRTWLGVFLEGRPRRGRPSTASAAPAVPERRAA